MATMNMTLIQRRRIFAQQHSSSSSILLKYKNHPNSSSSVKSLKESLLSKQQHQHKRFQVKLLSPSLFFSTSSSSSPLSSSLSSKCSPFTKKINHDANLNYLNDFSLCSFGTTSSGKDNVKTKEEDDEDEKDATEWIQPNRPLSGDIAQSHLYQTQLSPEGEGKEEDVDDAIKALEERLKQHELHGDTVHFIDLDSFDYSSPLDHNTNDNDDDGVGQFLVQEDGDTLDKFANQNDVIEVTNEMLIQDEEDVDDLVRNLDGDLFDMDDFIAQQQKQEEKEEESVPDWLQKRRSKQQQQSQTTTLPKGTMLPPTTKTRQQNLSNIPIKLNTLFSSTEIISCLSSLGGRNIKLLTPDPQRIQCDGLIVVTGLTTSHIKSMADALTRNLKSRKLDQNGIVGATKGVEGGVDVTTSKKARKRIGAGSRVEDSWMVVDCGNYVVHLQDDVTRRYIDLESLWSDEKGSEGYSILHEVDWESEEDVEEYLARNPVPEEYAEVMEKKEEMRMVSAMSVFGRKKWGQRWNPEVDSSMVEERMRKRKKTRRGVGGGGSAGGGGRSGRR